MKHSQEFIDWYNSKYGSLRSADFDRHQNNSYPIPAYASHMAMMPSVVEKVHETWLDEQ